MVDTPVNVIPHLLEGNKERGVFDLHNANFALDERHRRVISCTRLYTQQPCQELP
jgi:hypothetical protein